MQGLYLDGWIIHLEPVMIKVSAMIEVSVMIKVTIMVETSTSKIGIHGSDLFPSLDFKVGYHPLLLKRPDEPAMLDPGDL